MNIKKAIKSKAFRELAKGQRIIGKLMDGYDRKREKEKSFKIKVLKGLYKGKIFEVFQGGVNWVAVRIKGSPVVFYLKDVKVIERKNAGKRIGK